MPESGDTHLPAAAPRDPVDVVERDLVEALRSGDPNGHQFDGAVRRFVRARRDEACTVDEITSALRTVLQRHVEPRLSRPHARALRDAVLWFAVSEYYRAD